MNNSGNKKGRLYSLLLLLFIFSIFGSCSTSKTQYIFGKYSVGNKNSLSHENPTENNPAVESGEINLVCSDSNRNENKPKPITLNTEFTPNDTTWKHDTIRAAPKVEIGSDTVLTHVKKSAKQKSQQNQKAEKAKGSKAGLWIIVILTIIILGAVIVNNSIPDFGSGNIFHF